MSRYSNLVATLALFIALAGIALLGPASAAAASRTGGRVRKDVARLPTRERSDFVRAVLKLKRTRSPYDHRLNYYDQFVKWHRDLYHCTPGRLEMTGGAPGCFRSVKGALSQRSKR